MVTARGSICASGAGQGEGDRWGAYLFVNNVTDTTGNVAVATGYGYSGLTFSITPRTFGLNLSYKM